MTDARKFKRQDMERGGKSTRAEDRGSLAVQ